MRRISQRVVGMALMAAAAVILAGCQWLYGAYPPFPQGSPGPAATYTTGRATLKIGADPVTDLPILMEGGMTMEGIGASATFRNDDGWYLRILGTTKGSNLYGTTFMTLDRITDHQHRTAMDPGTCSFTVTKADPTGLEGRATCKGLRWSDALATGMISNYQTPYIEDEPAFDAEMTFEAAPSTTQAS